MEGADGGGATLEGALVPLFSSHKNLTTGEGGGGRGTGRRGGVGQGGGQGGGRGNQDMCDVGAESKGCTNAGKWWGTCGRRPQRSADNWGYIGVI